jgi:hypothetical protein
VSLVVFDRPHGDIELSGDPFHALAFRHQTQHFALSGCELAPGCIWREVRFRGASPVINGVR